MGEDEDEDDDTVAVPVEEVEDEPAAIVPEEEGTCEQDVAAPTCNRCDGGDDAEDEVDEAEGPLLLRSPLDSVCTAKLMEKETPPKMMERTQPK